MYERYKPNMEVLHREFRAEACFICRIVAGNPKQPTHTIYEEKEAIAFLDGYPRAYGYALVAPRKHKEQTTGDFTIEEYLDFQRLLYRVTEAVREEVKAERMYIYTFGSNQGNSHVHWHIVPLPPGIPYEDQQGVWASWDRGVLDIPQEDMTNLAACIGQRLKDGLVST